MDESPQAKCFGLDLKDDGKPLFRELCDLISRHFVTRGDPVGSMANFIAAAADLAIDEIEGLRFSVDENQYFDRYDWDIETTDRFKIEDWIPSSAHS